MFKEKVITINIFDPEILKVGTKIHAKYRNIIEDDYEDWLFDFDGIIGIYREEVLYVENPNEEDEYSLIADKFYPRQYRVDLEDVEDGYWVLELSE